MRIQRQEKRFEREQSMADQRMQFGMRQEEAEAERYISGQKAHADYERMKIRDQDGNNGWARQEASEIMKTMAEKGGNSTGAGIGMELGMGLGVGRAMGNMAGDFFSNMNQQVMGNQSGKLICPKCSSVNPEGMKFCGNCGTPLTPPVVKCSSCGQEIPAGMKFCGFCGTPVPQVPAEQLKCSQCGANIASGMKFCGVCGAKAE